jgi:hypothetical protein
VDKLLILSSFESKWTNTYQRDLSLIVAFKVTFAYYRPGTLMLLKLVCLGSCALSVITCFQPLTIIWVYVLKSSSQVLA